MNKIKNIFNKLSVKILLLGLVILIVIIYLSKNTVATDSNADQVHFVGGGLDATVIYSGRHCGLIDMMYPTVPQYVCRNENGECDDNEYVSLPEDDLENILVYPNEYVDNTGSDWLKKEDTSFNYTNYFIEVDGKYVKIPVMPNENSDQSDPTDNGTKVAKLVKSLGCNYLDFIIMTHNHSDHIGGAIEIAANGLVNDETIVFYKEDIKADDDFEDNCVDGFNGCPNTNTKKHFYNNEFFWYAYDAFNDKHATMCDVSKFETKKCTDTSNTFINNLTGETGQFDTYKTNVDDTYYFTFGNFTINLYSLYHLANHSENLNSIVTLVTHNSSKKKAVIMGDQLSRISEKSTESLANRVSALQLPTYPNGLKELKKIYGEESYKTYNDWKNDCETGILDYQYCAVWEKGVENQIADVIGDVDLVRAAHHGRLGSNSYYMMDTLNPDNIIISASYSSENSSARSERTAVLRELIYNKRGIHIYYTANSDASVAAVFSNNQINLINYKYDEHDEISVNKLPLMDILNDKPFPSTFYYADYLNTDVSQRIKMYFDENSNFVTGWQVIDNKLYYFKNNGIMQTGSQTIFGATYNFDDNTGALIDSNSYESGSNWILIDNKYYYLNDDKTVAIGWKRIGSRYYYFNDNGIMLTGWQVINNKLYYFKSNGIMQTGLQTISGATYTFDDNNGALIDSDSYESGSNWIIIDDKYYYLNDDKTVAIGWKRIGSRYYYFNDNGIMLTGWQVINNKLYYFKSNGIMQTGSQTISGAAYDISIDNGISKKGWVIIGDIWYYFNTDYTVSKGWKYIPSPESGTIYQYYFNNDGKMATGITEINGDKYYFGTKEDDDNKKYKEGALVSSICLTQNNKYYCFVENDSYDFQNNLIWASHYNFTDKIKNNEYYSLESDLIMNNNYIYTFKNNINVAYLRELIDTNSVINITNSSNGIISSSELVKTSDRIKINNNYYIVVIKGDTSGDGLVNRNDGILTAKYIIDGTGLDNEWKVAADYDNNNVVKMNDVLRILINK